MSTPLTMVDLAGAVVGTQKTIDFTAFNKFNPANRDMAHLRVYNDSGCGLSYKMVSSGNGDYIPAGGWATVELADNDSQMVVTVVYTLPNPPVSKILPSYYGPGESVPPIPILGNSPIGGGVSGNNTFSSETLAVGSLVEDIGFPGHTQLITINSDGSANWIVWDLLNSRQIGVFTIPGNLPITNPIGIEFVTRIQADNGIAFPAGVLSRIVSVGPTTIANAGTSVAHTLGVVPDFVLPIKDTGGATSDVIGINFGTMTSTNFTAYSSNAGGSGNVRFLVFKF